MGGTLGPDDTLTVGGRTIRAIACPIGIDAQDFIASAGSATARDVQQRMSESGIGRGLIVGVDRLDYSKGLAERFLGYERFLDEHPDRHARVYLLHIAPPSRRDVETYQHLRDSLDQLSGRINVAHADNVVVPFPPVHRRNPPHARAGFYRTTRTMPVTHLLAGVTP